MWWNKEKPKHIDVLKDIDAVIEYLEELKPKQLIPELKKLQELEKERHVANQGLLQINLETQAKVIEKILKHYEFFQNDVDINGIRVKQIAREFLRKAEEAGLKDLVKEKKKSHDWKLHW